MSKRNKRIIGKIEVKGNSVIKGIQYEGNRVVGTASDVLDKFASFDLDEIFIEDTIASYFGMKSDMTFIKEFKGFLPPLTIGGGIKTIKDAENMFNLGADKISINTYLFSNLDFLAKLISIFGAQAITVNIQLIKKKDSLVLLTCYGREVIKDINFIDWFYKVTKYKPGEIIINNVSRDGTLKGIDFDIIEKIKVNRCSRILYSGGVTLEQLNDKLTSKINNIDGYIISKSFHEINTKNLDYQSKNKIINLDNYITEKDSFPATNISIINVGIGNIGRLKNCLSKLNCNVSILNFTSDIPSNSILCLPGVGNFNQVMNNFVEIGLAKKLKRYLDDNRPLLAICIGMQVLFQSSEEVNEHPKDSDFLDLSKNNFKKTVEGLKIFEGKITKLQEGNEPIPNIGYKPTLSKDNLEDYYYYIHSYGLRVDDVKNKENIDQTSTFNNIKFVASYQTKNISAFQYHPEVSGPQGIIKLQKTLEKLKNII